MPQPSTHAMPTLYGVRPAEPLPDDLPDGLAEVARQLGGAFDPPRYSEPAPLETVQAPRGIQSSRLAHLDVTGVYVLLCRRRLVWIGKVASSGGPSSRNTTIRRRLQDHVRKLNRSRIPLSWVRFAYVPMPSAQALAVEHGLLAVYAPLWNRLGGFGRKIIKALPGSGWHQRYGLPA